MNRTILVIWFLPLVFMVIAFYVLMSSNLPFGARIVFTAVPLSIWVLGGIAIYKEYHEQERDHRAEEDVVREVKRILNEKDHHEKRQE